MKSLWLHCSIMFSCYSTVDPVTKKFMSDHLDPVFGYPSIVRFSWSTASLKLEEKAYPVRW